MRLSKEQRNEWGNLAVDLRKNGCTFSPLFPTSRSRSAPNMRLWLPDGTYIDFLASPNNDAIHDKEIELYKDVLAKVAA